VKFEFERGSNSNYVSNHRPYKSVLIGKVQLRSLGRISSPLALQRPNPRRLTAHLPAQHPLSSSHSLPSGSQTSAPISYPLLLSPHDPRRRSNRAAQARRRSSQASARDGARPGCPAGTHAKGRRARDGRRPGKR
jgi:hypothetical protein